MEIYVSSIGNDDGDGSRLHPYATLTKAQEHVRVCIKEKLRESITVHVLRGIYFLDKPIEFTNEDSGTKEFPVIYKADEGVVLTGAMHMEASWDESPDDCRIMEAQINPGLGIDGLLVDGQTYILARYPNEVPGALPLGSAANEVEIKARSICYRDPRGGYVRTLHNHRWGGNSYKIIGKDSDSPLGLSLEWMGDNNRGSEYDPDAIVVENVFEELDVPGEWFYDNASGMLYVYPYDGIDINKAVVEAVVSTELIRFSGNYGNPVKYIQIEGFTFKNTKRTMFTVDEPRKQYVPLLRGDWAVVRCGTVTIENAEYISLCNSEFSRIGGNGVLLSGYNKDITIDGNEFLDIGASCVQIVGLHNAVYEPSFWEHDHYIGNPDYPVHRTTVEQPDNFGPKTDEYPCRIMVSNNHMCNIGIFEKQSSGINLSVCKNVKILKNTIHKSARSCININDGTFGGHEIAWNDIFDSQRETTDHGPFNSWGRDRFWSVPEFNAQGLYGDIVRPFALLDVIEPIQIHDNRFHHSFGEPHTWGIDLDDGSSNYEIYNNLCLGLGIKLREGFDRRVYNNILIGGEIQVHCTYRQARDEIFRNIVISTHPWQFAGQSGGEKIRLLEGQVKADYNWYYTPKETPRLPEFWQELKLDNHAVINEDPMFRNEQGNDYTVCNSKVSEEIGFRNFSMDVFGKAGCLYKAPSYSLQFVSNHKKVLQKSNWQGAIITSIDNAIISSTASSGYDGIYFKDVPVDSPAYKAGFRTHDVLKKFDDVSILGIGDFNERIKDAYLTVATIYRRGGVCSITINSHKL